MKISSPSKLRPRPLNACRGSLDRGRRPSGFRAGRHHRALWRWVWLGFFAPLFTLLVEGLEPWEQELARLPFPTNHLALNLADGAHYLLRHWPSNQLIKALIIQPGATDELYFRPMETPRFSNPLSSWLEAVRVFTNHPSLQVVFNPPFLLLKRPTDRVKAGITVAHSRWNQWLEKTGPVAAHWVIADENWEQLQPQLHQRLKVPCSPAPASASAAHFYRAFVSGWNLSRPEILAAVCLATQTAATLEKRRIIFRREPPVREPKGKTP